MYTVFEKTSDKAIVVLRINDGAHALEELNQHGVAVLPGDCIQRL
jgi:hypothetical protein